MMDFWKLNKRKILPRLGVSLVLWCLYGLLLYLVGRRETDDVASRKEGARIIAILTVCLWIGAFILFYIAFTLQFYRARRICRSAPAELFDNATYHIGYLNRKSPVFYTKECLFGYVEGYPVTVHYSAGGRGTPATLDFHVFITKFKTTKAERIAFQLKRGRIPDNVSQDVRALVLKLKGKEYPIPNIDSEQAADIIYKTG